MSNKERKEKKVRLYWDTVFDGLLETLPILTQPYIKINMDELLEEVEEAEKGIQFFWPERNTETQKIVIDDLREENPGLFK